MSPFVAMKAAKDELRQQMRELRLALSAEDVARAGVAAAQRFHEVHGADAARTVALYAPMRREIDTAPLAAQLRSRGVRICYPRVMPGRRLTFHESPEGGLAASAIGIPEPAADAPALSLTEIDLFVVPGLAFDPHGARLGWGRGYYDNTLAAAPQALRVGLAHAFQIIADVPAHGGDVRMDWLLTEQGARSTGARPPTLRRIQ